MTVQASLFDPSPALLAGRRALRLTASRHQHDIERLVPLARELAALARGRPGSEDLGLTVADLREVAVLRGLLTGQERGKQLSYLGAVMKAAGLTNTGVYRRSHIEKTHGNPHIIWRAP